MSSSSDGVEATELETQAEFDPKARAIAFAEGLAAASGLDIYVVAREEGPENLVIAFEGPDSRFLVGRAGQVLDSLQYLTQLVTGGRRFGAYSGGRLRVTFDADSYRARREATLRKLAQELVEQVRATGQEAVLDPLSAMERRIVHQAISDEPGIRTYSEGEDPDRYIVIAPA
jgi:spoIIIJ-associated protein